MLASAAPLASPCVRRDTDTSLEMYWEMWCSRCLNGASRSHRDSVHHKSGTDDDISEAAMSRYKKHGTGYDLSIRRDNMDHVDVQVLSSHLRQRRNTVWDNLDISPRTSPSESVILRPHARARTRTGLLGLQTAMLGHFWTCLFPCTACSACCASGWAATSYPETPDAGFMCQD